MRVAAIDGSVISAWLLDEERGPAADRFLEGLLAAGYRVAVSPAAATDLARQLARIRLERGLAAADVEEAIDLFFQLRPLSPTPEADLHHRALALAEAHRLSDFDVAIDLALAETFSSELWTADPERYGPLFGSLLWLRKIEDARVPTAAEPSRHAKPTEDGGRKAAKSTGGKRS